MSSYLAKKIQSIVLTTVVTAVIMPSFSIAQEAPKPSRSVETYASWDVECTTVKVRKAKQSAKVEEKDKKKKDAKKKASKKKDAKTKKANVAEFETRTICEAVQPYRNRKTNNEVARMAVAVDSKDKKKIVAVLRTLIDVSFEGTPAIVDDGKDIVKGKFQSCLNKYCFIRFSLEKKSFDALTKSKKLGVQYPLSNGKLIRIGMSSEGLVDAVSTLRNK